MGRNLSITPLRWANLLARKKFHNYAEV
jgi:hypothetical protein